jgi:hypothetical protein
MEVKQAPQVEIPAAAKPAAKPEEKKEPLDPRAKYLPLAIFGACAFVAAIEFVVGLIIG